MVKFKIILEAIEDFGSTKKGEKIAIYNEIFNPLNGIVFFPIGKDFKIVSYHQYITTIKKTLDIYENDIVLVQGAKRVGNYVTEVIRTTQGFTLKENKTILNDDACLIAIISIENDI